MTPTLLETTGFNGRILRPLRRVATILAVVAILGTSARTVGADVVVDWNAIALSTLGGQNPFFQSRLLSMVHLAVFEAVNAITRTHQPYLGTIVAPPGASPEAAAATAAHAVLRAVTTSAAWPGLDDAYQHSLMAIPDGTAKDDGVAIGKAAATAMLLAREHDGATPLAFAPPGPAEPGTWQSTPGCPPMGAVFANWGSVTPFGVASAADFVAGPPPALTSRAYAKAYDEVKRVGAMDSLDRTPDRSDVARAYAGMSPGYVMNLAARQVVLERDPSLVDTARSFALLNMAINDGFIVTFATKYTYNRWRPETAIHAGDADGNPDTEADAGWAPFVFAPCFPSFTSAHAGGSYAGAEVLRRLFGAGGHDITITHPAFSGLAFSYTTFKAITADIDDARVYGGIHFRFDQDTGGRLGRAVADDVIEHKLLPLDGSQP